jgi:hypothetical protein
MSNRITRNGRFIVAVLGVAHAQNAALFLPCDADTDYCHEFVRGWMLWMIEAKDIIRSESAWAWKSIRGLLKSKVRRPVLRGPFFGRR